MKTIKTEYLYGGMHILTACERAVEKALAENCHVEFEFNGQKITASPDSNPELMVQAFTAECERSHKAYLASPEYKAMKEEEARKTSERKARAEAILARAPAAMTLADAEGWEKAKAANSDAYGEAVMIYGERWARMMEARMADGERIADIAVECSQLADEEGITGFMYGAAIATLSQVWKHGEELKAWHSLRMQRGEQA